MPEASASERLILSHIENINVGLQSINTRLNAMLTDMATKRDMEALRREYESDLKELKTAFSSQVNGLETRIKDLKTEKAEQDKQSALQVAENKKNRNAMMTAIIVASISGFSSIIGIVITVVSNGGA